MPYARPTRTDLQKQVQQDMVANLPGSDTLLRFSNLGVLGRAQAELANLHYGYLDWIAKQATPISADDEYLEGWAALKDVYRKNATQAQGSIRFVANPGAQLPAGTPFRRADGVTGTISQAVNAEPSGILIAPGLIDADPSGLTGAFGNGPIGTIISLSSAIDGIQATGHAATAFTGGADLESNESLRQRMLAAYQNQPQGGAVNDYIIWALQVPGVTRAWCAPNGFGIGTVVVYVMLDEAESAQGGFPVGTDGVSSQEARGIHATGDQLRVADYLYPLRPVTALVYVVAPVQNPVNFHIQGMPLASQADATAAINSVFVEYGQPGGMIALQAVWNAIASATGVMDFVIVSPSNNLTNPTGALPTLEKISWS